VGYKNSRILTNNYSCIFQTVKYTTTGNRMSFIELRRGSRWPVTSDGSKPISYRKLYWMANIVKYTV